MIWVKMWQYLSELWGKADLVRKAVLVAAAECLTLPSRSQHDTLHHTITRYTLPSFTLPYHTIPYHTIPYHALFTCVHSGLSVAEHLLAFKILKNRVESLEKEESMLTAKWRSRGWGAIALKTVGNSRDHTAGGEVVGDCFQNRKQLKTVDTSLLEE